MSTKPLVIRGVMLAALLLSAGFPLHAEVSSEPNDDSCNVLILAIIEDPDPVPLATWESVREDPTEDILNSAGEQRGDGRADVAIDPTTRLPLVTWSYRAGSDHDIVVSEWTEEGWGPYVFITSGTEDELDPRVYIDSEGTAYLVWWVAGPSPRVMLATREAGSDVWGSPREITDNGRRPSVTRDGGLTLIAYERDWVDGGQEIVLVTLVDVGVPFFEIVATTSATARLDVIVHAAGGVRWVDWIDSDDALAYSVWSGGSWSEPVTVPRGVKTWVEELELRKLIRSNVLAP